MNNCNFIGTVFTKPELLPTPSGTSTVRFLLEIERLYKRSNGETATELTRLWMEAWDSGAKAIYSTFRIGDKIAVEASAKYGGPDTAFRINRFYAL